MRSAKNLLVALSVAMVVYVICAALIFQKVIGVTCALTRRPPPAPLVVGGRVNVFGHYLPMPLVISVASVAPCWWLTAVSFTVVRRRNRESRGQCLDCGHVLRGRRGRCPGCGVRFERSLPPDRHFAMPVLPKPRGRPM